MTETIISSPTTQVNPHNSPILSELPDFWKEDDMSNYVKVSANVATAVKITALYARLSIGDERHGGGSGEDSNSIVNRKRGMPNNTVLFSYVV
jgi:hypothetical protein